MIIFPKTGGGRRKKNTEGDGDSELVSKRRRQAENGYDRNEEIWRKRESGCAAKISNVSHPEYRE